MIKTAFEVIQENEPTFLDGCQIFEKNQLENIKVDMGVVIAPGLTAFSASTLTEDPAGFPNGHSNTHTPVDATYYHDGAGALPAGNSSDNVYSDPAGTIYLASGTYYLGSETWMSVSGTPGTGVVGNYDAFQGGG